MPNLLLQMLLRSANAVGYTNYPDNVVQYFVRRRRLRASTCSASSIRSTGSKTCASRWMRCARPASLCEAAICYTGNLSDPAQTKYDLKYYLQLARELKRRSRTSSASRTWRASASRARRYTLVKALKEEIGLPVHFHTHDTSGIAAASVLAAIDAGADAVDGAMDSMSGLTSQPNLGSIVEALRSRTARHRARSREPASAVRLLGAGARIATRPSRATCDPAPPRSMCTACLAASSPICASRLARSGIDDMRWPEVAQAYAEVNELFGDIVKVTPTSKVVGDMALMMVTSGLTAEQVLDPDTRDRVSRIGRVVVPRRSRPAVWRLSRSAAEESPEGRDSR